MCLHSNCSWSCFLIVRRLAACSQVAVAGTDDDSLGPERELFRLSGEDGGGRTGTLPSHGNDGSAVNHSQTPSGVEHHT